MLLLLAGAFGATVNSSSGRAVMHWFDASERGLALGDPPDGGADRRASGSALVLPALVSGDDPRAALLALAAVCLAGALAGLVVLRERPAADPEHDAVASARRRCATAASGCSPAAAR